MSRLKKQIQEQEETHSDSDDRDATKIDLLEHGFHEIDFFETYYSWTLMTLKERLPLRQQLVHSLSSCLPSAS
jgi:hypothetical protein